MKQLQSAKLANRAVASALNSRGIATLLFDLLTPAEQADRRNVFNIPLLADRLVDAVNWLDRQPKPAWLPLGLFGASTAAAAAVVAAANLPLRVCAVVSRGGRPDLAGDSLDRVGCRPSSSLAAQMSKAGHVRPEEFNDRYEDAVVELIRTKQAGIPAKVTELPSRPSNVVSIMDALRKSVAAEEAAPSSAGKQHEARRGSGRRAQTKGSLEDEGQG